MCSPRNIIHDLKQRLQTKFLWNSSRGERGFIEVYELHLSHLWSCRHNRLPCRSKRPHWVLRLYVSNPWSPYSLFHSTHNITSSILTSQINRVWYGMIQITLWVIKRSETTLPIWNPKQHGWANTHCPPYLPPRVADAKTTRTVNIYKTYCHTTLEHQMTKWSLLHYSVRVHQSISNVSELWCGVVRWDEMITCLSDTWQSTSYQSIAPKVSKVSEIANTLNLAHNFAVIEVNQINPGLSPTRCIIMTRLKVCAKKT